MAPPFRSPFSFDQFDRNFTHTQSHAGIRRHTQTVLDERFQVQHSQRPMCAPAPGMAPPFRSPSKFVQVDRNFRHTQTVIDRRSQLLRRLLGPTSSTEQPLDVTWPLHYSGQVAMAAIVLDYIVSHTSKVNDNEAMDKLVADVAHLRAERGVPPVRWLVPPVPYLPQLGYGSGGDDLSLIQMFMVLDILKEALRRMRVLEVQVSAHLEEIRDNGFGQDVFENSPPNGAVFS